MLRTSFRKRAIGLFIFIWTTGLLGSGEALACAVCGGDKGSPLTKSALAGVAFLAGVIALMLTAIATLATTWTLRARRLQRMEQRP